jgi:hypothetical protein
MNHNDHVKDVRSKGKSVVCIRHYGPNIARVPIRSRLDDAGDASRVDIHRRHKMTDAR